MISNKLEFLIALYNRYFYVIEESLALADKMNNHSEFFVSAPKFWRSYILKYNKIIDRYESFI